jgi:hypothetical protein
MMLSRVSVIRRYPAKTPLRKALQVTAVDITSTAYLDWEALWG